MDHKWDFYHASLRKNVLVLRKRKFRRCEYVNTVFCKEVVKVNLRKDMLIVVEKDIYN